jgi:hypothetical protein
MKVCKSRQPEEYPCAISFLLEMCTCIDIHIHTCTHSHSTSRLTSVVAWGAFICNVSSYSCARNVYIHKHVHITWHISICRLTCVMAWDTSPAISSRTIMFDILATRVSKDPENKGISSSCMRMYVCIYVCMCMCMYVWENTCEQKQIFKIFVYACTCLTQRCSIHGRKLSVIRLDAHPKAHAHKYMCSHVCLM